MLNLFVIAALATAAASAAYGFAVEDKIRRVKKEIEDSREEAKRVPEEMFHMEQKQKIELDKVIKDLIKNHPTIKLDDLDKNKWESK